MSEEHHDEELPVEEDVVGPEEESPVDAGTSVRLRDVLEALVFAHRGILPPKTVREVLGEEFTVDEIDEAFIELREDYERRGGAIVLLEVAGGYQFGTRPELAEWIRKLDFYQNHRHLSRPSLETLAIVAYKQPATRAEIEAIRGVNVERIVRNLLEKKLIRVLGHKDVPGRPMVLGTTAEFLELFGLGSLSDLPPLREFVGQPAGIDDDEDRELYERGGDGETGDDGVETRTEAEPDGSGEETEPDEGPEEPGFDEDAEEHEAGGSAEEPETVEAPDKPEAVEAPEEPEAGDGPEDPEVGDVPEDPDGVKDLEGYEAVEAPGRLSDDEPPQEP